MPFDEQSLSEARSQGYTDDQIYQHLAGSDERFRVAKENGYSLDDVAAHLTQKGGEQDNDKQETRMGGDAQRAADQQVQDRVEEGEYPSEQRVQAYGQQRMREDGAGEPQAPEREGVLLTPKAKEGGEVVGEKANQDEGTRQGQENGQGLSIESPAGLQAQVAQKPAAFSEVPPQGEQGIVEKIKQKPKEAAIATGATVAEGAIEMGLGMAAARGVSTLTAPLGPVVSAGLGMTAFAATQYLSDKLIKAGESALGIRKPIEEAKQAQPELSEIANIAIQAPFAIQSLKNLGASFADKLTTEGARAAATELAGKLTAGAAGGAAFAPIRYGVERGAQAVGLEEKTQPMTLKEFGVDAIIGAIMRGHAEAKISEAGLPETAKVAAETAPEPLIEEQAIAASKAIEQPETIQLPSLEEKPAEAPAEAQPQPTYAPEARKVEEGPQGEYPPGDQGREAAEAGRGYGLQPAEEGAVEVPKEEVTYTRASSGAEIKDLPPEEDAPEGSRIASAAYKAPDNQIYTGESHVDAIKDAVSKIEDPEQKAEAAQELEKVKDDPEARNTEKYGYVAKAPDGTEFFADREQGHDISKDAGQLKSATEELAFPVKEGEEVVGAKVHSNETLKEEHPEVTPQEVNFAKDIANEARVRISDLTEGEMGTPDAMNRLSSIGASVILDHIAETKKPMDFTTFAGEMQTQLGKKIVDQLPEIYEASKDKVNNFQTATAKPEPKLQEPKVEVRPSVSMKQSLRAQEKAGEAGYKRGIAEMRPVISDLKKTISQSFSKAQMLTEYLRGQEKGARTGAEYAAKDTKANAEMAMRWHDADKNAIKEKVSNLLFKEIPQSGIKMRAGDIKNFSNELNRILTTPFNWRGGRVIDGNFVSTSEMMLNKVDNLVDRIQGAANEAYATDLRNEIRDVVPTIFKSPSVAAEFKGYLRTALEGVALRQISPASEARLRVKQAELQAQGKELPARMMSKLIDLGKTNIKDLSVEELEALRGTIKQIEEDGRFQYKTRQEANKAREQGLIADIANNPKIKPLNEFEKMVRDTSVSGWQKIKDAVQNKIKGILNWGSVHEKSRLVSDTLFKILDGEENGWLAKNLKQPLLNGLRQFQVDFGKAKEKAIDIAKEEGLGDYNFLNISIHAHKIQGGTNEELLKYSTEKDILGAAIEKYEKDGLSSGEKRLYNYFRKELDNNLSGMVDFAKDHLNQELKLVDNYFPRSVDQRKASKWRSEREKISNPITGKEYDATNIGDILRYTWDFGQAKRRSVERGMLKERVEGAEIPLNLNSMEVFLNHMENWHYAKNIEPTLREVGRIANSNVFATKYGNVGKGLVLDYIDAMARKGKYSRNNFEKALDSYRNLTMIGTLGLRLSQAKHLANYPLGFYEAGGANWWAKGNLIAKTPEGREWIQKNMPQIYERGGGDITIAEAAGKATPTKALFIGDRVLDYHNAVGTGLGSYLKALSEAGYNWKDFNKIPPDSRLLNESNKKVIRTVGSPAISEAPLIVTKGTSVGTKSLGKAFMAYQMPKMVRWSRMRELFTGDMLEKKQYGKFATEMALLGFGSLMEASISVASKKAYIMAASGILSALGYAVYHRKHEEELQKELSSDAAADFVSTIPGGDVGKKFIQAGKYPQAAEKIFSSTGVPTIDATTQIMSSGFNFMFDPTLKKARTFAEDTATFMGPFASVVQTEREGQKLLDKKHQAALDRAQLIKESGKKKKKKTQ
jgi:hypothetical protein